MAQMRFARFRAAARADRDGAPRGTRRGDDAHHLPVLRYVPLETFATFEREANAMGFTHAAVGPMVRSSYHADRQAHAAGIA